MVSSQIFIMWGRINQTKEPKTKIKIYRAIVQTYDKILQITTSGYSKNLHIIDIICEPFWKMMFNLHLVWPSNVNWWSSPRYTCCTDIALLSFFSEWARCFQARPGNTAHVQESHTHPSSLPCACWDKQGCILPENGRLGLHRLCLFQLPLPFV